MGLLSACHRRGQQGLLCYRAGGQRPDRCPQRTSRPWIQRGNLGQPRERLPLCRAPRTRSPLSPPQSGDRPPPTRLVVKYFTRQVCGGEVDRTDERETGVPDAVTDHLGGDRGRAGRLLLWALEVQGG